MALEGIDGAGKSTQARQLVAWLEEIGLPALATREPTDGPHGARLRASMTTGRLPPVDELELFVKDREQHVRECIAPALAAGRSVVVDRYYYSTAAYQGARGLDPAAILARNEAFAPRPDLVALIVIPPELALTRIAARGDRANLFERAEALQRVDAIFASLVDPAIVRIDGEQSADDVQRAIRAALCAGPLARVLGLAAGSSIAQVEAARAGA